MKKVWKTLAVLLLAAVFVVAAYVAYVFIAYHRIADNQVLAVNKGNAGAAAVGETYTAVTYNIGYGAYPPDYTFFMDGGTESRARSSEAVDESIAGSIATLDGLAPDFILLQEVDLDATRTMHTNEFRKFRDAFFDYENINAVNYDSPYLFYPLSEPIGKTKSCIATFSKYSITSAVRRSLPISEGVSKLIDLDRCYSVAEIPVTNGKTLYLYNVHLSAYGNEGGVSGRQVDMLLADMQEKYLAGDYVVCGGDFNHDFTGDSIEQMNDGSPERLSWAQPFPEEKLPDGISMCRSYVGDVSVPSARNLDAPYVKGESLVLILDGFLVSDNVACVSVENIDNGFLYSDHNPVRLRFRLLEA